MQPVCGVDEAGRGPLAGPVVAAAVVLCEGGIEGLNDSKKLSARRRATLEAEIRIIVAPGSVLGISGVTPGHATLCHGERVVAHGELVEVDGHLGLHITRVVFDQ